VEKLKRKRGKVVVDEGEMRGYPQGSSKIVRHMSKKGLEATTPSQTINT